MREFLSVVQGQCFGHAHIRLEALLNSLGHQDCPCKRHFGQQGHAALALDQGHDRLLVPSPNHGIAFPVPNLLAAVDAGRAQGNRHPHGDLSTPVLASPQPFAPGLLASAVFVQTPALGFLGVDAQVNRLMADGKVPCNLLGAPVAADIGLNALPQAGRNRFGIAAVAGALGRFAAGLFSSVSLKSTFNLTPNGAGVSPEQAGDLGGTMLGSHKALDLVWFFSAEVFVHWATSTWRLKRP
jgi:hypothetical protein